MSIYSTAVKRPITTLVIFIAVIVMGVFSLRNMPVDLYPEIDPPFISVFTIYPGASAADIETNVTRPLEDNLSIVTNLKNMTSQSRDDISAITMEFEYETNLDEATNEIRDVIGRILRFLPEGIEQPTVFKFSSAMIPVMMLSATADESYPALAKILDERLINPLNRIEGVGAVGIFGGPEREIQINVDPRKLEAYNMSVEQLGGILAAENINLPSGNVKFGSVDYPLRFTGEFTESSRINNIVITSFNGNPVYVRDVAEVNDTLREMTIEERINGRQGLRLIVQKQSGANTVQIANEVNKMLEEIIKTLPPDIAIGVVFDTSEFINNSISNLINILYYAGIFVTLVVLFFIGRWRATFIIILTIPVSLVTAFIYLYFTGNTLNLISLSSLTIAMGMVVDDAIVVLENITRHIEKGSSARESAIYGTNEVGLAVVASTLTVVAVFLPMTLISGLMGLFFRQLGWIVTITITVSTIAALSLTPMLSSQLLKFSSAKRTGLGPKTSAFIDNALSGLDRFYSNVLGWGVGNKWKVVFISVSIFFASLFLTGYIGTGFFPEADNSRISINIELPTGLRLEETSKTARAIEKIIEEDYPEIEAINTSSGYSSTAGIFGNPRAGSHTIDLTFRLVAPNQRSRDVWEIADALREELSVFPEIVTYTVQTEGGGFGAGAPVQVEIYGDDFNTTNAFAEELAQKMRAIEGTRDVDLSRGPEKPELRIVPDQEKMAMFGLNTNTVSRAIRNRIEGMTATRFREDGDEYDVVIRHKEEFRNTFSDIENIQVLNPMGQMVRLKEFASIEEFYSPPNIERKNRMRYLTVNSQLHGRSLGNVTTDIQAAIEEMEIPPGITYRFAGEIQEQQDAFADLVLLLLLSIFLVYVVMASQFESFSMPFIIMLAVPFSFTGVLLALFISGGELNVISFIGAIILVGIVVKNSIVLVDYTNLLVGRGKSIVTAVRMAGKSRLRPVLMTTLTTLLAMIPLAISTAEGSEIWQPMGVAVIGGLSFSTLITLVFVPVVYTLNGARKIKKARKRNRKALLLQAQ
ncbi:MAG: efflux RND transporter permease subunit [Bacteroidetes bacterium]|nr:MAG: efflux RND transporter permease subunit [Bacteroidota bacterium]